MLKLHRSGRIITLVATLGVVVLPGLMPATPGPGHVLRGQTTSSNPYRATFHWERLPQGRTLGIVSGVIPDPDGEHLWILDRCGANQCGVTCADGGPSAADALANGWPGPTPLTRASTARAAWSSTGQTCADDAVMKPVTVSVGRESMADVTCFAHRLNPTGDQTGPGDDPNTRRSNERSSDVYSRGWSVVDLGVT